MEPLLVTISKLSNPYFCQNEFHVQVINSCILLTDHWHIMVAARSKTPQISSRYRNGPDEVGLSLPLL